MSDHRLLHRSALSTLDKRFIDLVVGAGITDRKHANEIVMAQDGRVRGAWLRALDALDRDPSTARCYVARRECSCIVFVLREDELRPADRDRRLAEWRIAGLAIELILSADARLSECQHLVSQPNMFDS